MKDVILIGGGESGRSVAADCVAHGLDVIVIDASAEKPESVSCEWIHGRGAVYAPGLIAVLDVNTADERRLVQGKAIVVAVGEVVNGAMPSKMLGISKLGAEFSSDAVAIKTNSDGETRARGIYATGACASVATPGLVAALARYCAGSIKEKTAESTSVKSMDGNGIGS